MTDLVRSVYQEMQKSGKKIALSAAVKEMSEGELLQIEKTRKLDIEESVYFEIIRKKTAALIAACCACGANSANQDEEVVKKLHLFGETAGIAFQIKDDLFDYTHSPIIGKPTGIDIREQKMTLPLIYTLSISDKTQKKMIINTIKNHNKDSEKITDIIELVKKSGGLEYATKKMNEYHQRALSILDEFEESEAKTALTKMIDFVIERKQ